VAPYRSRKPGQIHDRDNNRHQFPKGAQHAFGYVMGHEYGGNCTVRNIWTVKRFHPMAPLAALPSGIPGGAEGLFSHL
jgi:hypothetical protein